jgi:hypothetical protein
VTSTVTTPGFPARHGPNIVGRSHTTDVSSRREGAAAVAMPIDPADYFDLTADDLRQVARYAVGSAEDVLSLFEQVHPGDGRPRAAVDAAWTFVNGVKRTKLQRVTALDAHRGRKRLAPTPPSTQPLLLAPLLGPPGF